MPLIPMRGNLYANKEDSLSYQTWVDLNNLLGSGGGIPSGILFFDTVNSRVGVNAFPSGTFSVFGPSGDGLNSLFAVCTPDGHKWFAIDDYGRVHVESTYKNVLIGNNVFPYISGAQGTVAIGDNALGQNALGNDPSITNSIAIGTNAMGNKAQWESIAIGTNAMLNGNDYGNFGIAIGNGSMANAGQLGESNIAIGYNAMGSLHSGWPGYYYGDVDNIGIGSYALKGFDNTSAGWFNVAIGEHALNSVQLAIGNVAIGHDTGSTITTGCNNTLVGVGAGFDYVYPPLVNGSGNIYLGAKTTGSDDGACGEFVAGSNYFPITDVYFGQGPLSNNPQPYTIHGTDSTTVIRGGDLNLAGGRAYYANRGGGVVRIKIAPNGSGTILATTAVFNPDGLNVSGAYFCNSVSGYTGSQTFKDGAGITKTMTITGGIITDIV